jgi:hypothetical protein
MQGLLHSLAYLWNQTLIGIPLSYEMFLLAHHEKKKMNVSGKIVPTFILAIVKFECRDLFLTDVQPHFD